MAKLADKVQNALDETRILILGSQVLLGLQLRSVFEPSFDHLPLYSRWLQLAGIALMVIGVGLLLTPPSYHRLVEGGMDTPGFHRFVSRLAGPALMPFIAALAIDVFSAGQTVLGTVAAAWLAGAGALVCVVFLYGLELVQRRRRWAAIEEVKRMSSDDQPGTELTTKIRHVLTEARVVLPGAQALLGFQFTTVLTQAFEELPRSSKLLHLASLSLVGLAVVLLLTPAAYHRVVERGEETEHFHRFASAFVLAAMIPLGLGISGDLFLVARKITGSLGIAVAMGAGALAVLLGLWFGLTLTVRARRRSTPAAPRPSRRPPAYPRQWSDAS